MEHGTQWGCDGSDNSSSSSSRSASDLLPAKGLEQGQTCGVHLADRCTPGALGGVLAQPKQLPGLSHRCCLVLCVVSAGHQLPCLRSWTTFYSSYARDLNHQERFCSWNPTTRPSKLLAPAQQGTSSAWGKALHATRNRTSLTQAAHHLPSAVNQLFFSPAAHGSLAPHSFDFCCVRTSLQPLSSPSSCLVPPGRLLLLIWEQ